MEKPAWWVPHLVLLICQVTFSVMHVVSADALNYIPPLCFAALRTACALPPLWLVARRTESHPRFARKDIARFALLGILGVALPQGLIFVGIHLAGPELASIMQPTVPVYVALLSVLLRYETATPLKGAGGAAAVAGALVLLIPWGGSSASGGGTSGHGVPLPGGAAAGDAVLAPLGRDGAGGDGGGVDSSHTLGLVVMIVQTASYASFILLLSRTLRVHPHPFTVFAYATSFGAAALTAVAARDLVATLAWTSVPLRAWATLAYASWGVSFVAHGSLSWAVRHISAVVPSLYTCLQPLMTTLLASLFLGDAFSAHDAIGLVLIVSGLLATVKAKYDEGAAGAAAVAGVLRDDSAQHGSELSALSRRGGAVGLSELHAVPMKGGGEGAVEQDADGEDLPLLRAVPSTSVISVWEDAEGGA